MTQARKSVRWRIRPGERRILLVILDGLAASLALLIALYFWGENDPYLHEFGLEFLRARTQFWFYLLPVGWIVLLVEMYDVRRAHRSSDTVRGVSLAAGIYLTVYLLVFFLLNRNLPRLGVGIFIAGAFCLTLVGRFAYISVFNAPQFTRRVLVIGAGKAGSALLKMIEGFTPAPFFVVGLIDDDPEKRGTRICGYPVLGGSDCLLDVIEQENISDLIFAISGEMQGKTFQAILDAEDQGVEVTTMPVIYEEQLGRVPIFHLDTDWILRSFVDQAHANAGYEMAKRLMDILGGLAGSLVLVVLLPFIALAILIDSGAPVFFLQNRLGKNGQMYKIIKFRTMRQDSEREGEVRVTMQNDERITRVGLFLRRSHIDELPQFINVLKGEMSLVGPRAERSELVSQLQQNIPFYRARLLVKPGITGWAQVNFGYAATVEDTAVKLEYDLYYIKHRNLVMDVVILLRTFGTVIGLRGQ